MPELTVAATTHAEPASTNPRTSLGPDLEVADPSSWDHPLSEQTIDTIDDTQYARSCRCGIVLDAWSTDDGVEAGLRRLASQRRTPN
jgi:hypothetical protein